MKEVCIVILVAVVIGGFAFSVDVDPQYAWVYSGMFEGDILLEPELEGKHGKIDTEWRWPNGVIYYQFHPTIDQDQQDIIKGAIAEYHMKTCLKVLPRTNQENYVEFLKDEKGCFAKVGMHGGRQVINLNEAEGCIFHGNIVHVLMHAFGFWHQHSDPKRDDYVTILLDNVRPSEDPNLDNRLNFVKYGDDEATDFGVGYDYGSIMHYPRDAFAKEGTFTIVPKDPNAKIGQQKGLSPKDIKKLHRMYNMADDCKPTL